MIRQIIPTIIISDLIRDPILAAIFRNAERGGLAGAELDRPQSPAPSTAAAADRELELA